MFAWWDTDQIEPDIYMVWCIFSKSMDSKLEKLGLPYFKEELMRQGDGKCHYLLDQLRACNLAFHSGTINQTVTCPDWYTQSSEPTLFAYLSLSQSKLQILEGLLDTHQYQSFFPSKLQNRHGTVSFTLQFYTMVIQDP